MRDLIRDISAEKVIVISTHILEEVEAVCTRAIVIDRGRVVADETPQALKRRSAYHNAVKMRVAGAKTKSAIRMLEAMKRVERVETSNAAGQLEITVVTKGGQPILDEVRRVAGDHRSSKKRAT